MTDPLADRERTSHAIDKYTDLKTIRAAYR